MSDPYEIFDNEIRPTFIKLEGFSEETWNSMMLIFKLMFSIGFLYGKDEIIE